MKKIKLLLLFLSISCFFINIYPANAESQVPYGIVSANYSTDPVRAFFHGTSPINEDVEISLYVNYHVEITYRYNEATGKIYGTPSAPKIVFDDKGVAEEVEATEILYKATVDSDGYGITYSNISFVPVAINSFTRQTYNRYTHGTRVYVP